MQYADITGGGLQPLLAEPGGAYDMVPGPGQPEDLPVPPGDGLWGPGAEDSSGEATAAVKAPAGKAAAGKGGGE